MRKDFGPWTEMATLAGKYPFAGATAKSRRGSRLVIVGSVLAAIVGLIEVGRGNGPVGWMLVGLGAFFGGLFFYGLRRDRTFESVQINSESITKVSTDSIETVPLAQLRAVEYYRDRSGFVLSYDDGGKMRTVAIPSDAEFTPRFLSACRSAGLEPELWSSPP